MRVSFLCSGNRMSLFVQILTVLSFSPHIHIIYDSYFLYYIFVCLSKVFQRTISFSWLPFVVESVCKVRSFFRNHQTFSKVFFKKFFWRRKLNPSGCRSRSLNAVKVRYLDRRRTAASCSVSFQIVISSTSFPLESGCKITHFFAFSNFYPHFFSKFLQENS